MATTAYRYVILGKYRGKTEEIDSADTRKEANRLVGEYQMAFGAGWSLWIKDIEEQEN